MRKAHITLGQGRVELDRTLNLFAQLKTEEVEIVNHDMRPENGAFIDALLIAGVRNKCASNNSRNKHPPSGLTGCVSIN